MTREELVLHLGDRMTRAGGRVLRRLLAVRAGDTPATWEELRVGMEDRMTRAGRRELRRLLAAAAAARDEAAVALLCEAIGDEAAILAEAPAKAAERAARRKTAEEAWCAAYAADQAYVRALLRRIREDKTRAIAEFRIAERARKKAWRAELRELKKARLARARADRERRAAEKRREQADAKRRKYARERARQKAAEKAERERLAAGRAEERKP